LFAAATALAIRITENGVERIPPLEPALLPAPRINALTQAAALMRGQGRAGAGRHGGKLGQQARLRRVEAIVQVG
jgi:hypothetical protein